MLDIENELFDALSKLGFGQYPFAKKMAVLKHFPDQECAVIVYYDLYYGRSGALRIERRGLLYTDPNRTTHFKLAVVVQDQTFVFPTDGWSARLLHKVPELYPARVQTRQPALQLV